MRLRVRDFFEPKNFRPVKFMHPNCLHWFCFTLLSEIRNGAAGNRDMAGKAATGSGRAERE
jgi:hypothetical protein